jgi:hypothetical protein
LAAFLTVGSSGCGPPGVIYTAYANVAQSKIEQARVLGAERYAEFEFHYAQEHLKKAMEEAAEAWYGDAIIFARIARDYALQAIEKASATHRGAGR